VTATTALQCTQHPVPHPTSLSSRCSDRGESFEWTSKRSSEWVREFLHARYKFS
jgi:hypothetical protein